ncbi:MAG: aminotransferase class V-fold PLP-dependent enzyme, partial [Bacillota bacterium]|nr:aminotransferase class V-fold PLP-dependent enzyme [Bacillota bacterium]
MIYLDNAATSWPKPERVYQALAQFLRTTGANPGRGAHQMAQEASRAIYRTRQRLAEFLGAARPEEIVFTSNATEALNLAIKGVLAPGDHVVTSSMEHNSVARPLMALQEQGVEVT